MPQTLERKTKNEEGRVLNHILVAVFLTLLLFTFYLLPKSAEAQIPNPRVPCGESDENPEFNALRPYQASPCGDSPKLYYCGNEILIYETAQHTLTGSQNVCSVNEYNIKKRVNKTYDIALKDVEFPIAGNTQDVKNSQNVSGGFDDATKVNEYVSWYLSGANSKAETGESTNDQIVNYSGPIQKLFPQAIQDYQRVQTIESVTKTIAYREDSGGTKKEETVIEEPSGHDQIVVCADKSILGIFGHVVPHECYKSSNSKAKDEYRLTDWNDDLSFTRKISNAARNFFSKIPIINNLLGQVATDAWNKRTPPLPWDDGNGKPFASNLLFQKAYNEWRGDSCLIIPGVEKLLCFDNPAVTNEYSDLYQYIPLANTSDKKSLVMIPNVEVRPISRTELNPDKPDYQILEQVVLYYPHTLEDAQLSTLLKSSYKPQKGTNEDTDSTTTESDYNNMGQCRLLDARINEGDDLFPEVAPNSFRVRVNPYTIETIPCNGACTHVTNKFGVDVYSKKCEGGATVTIPTITKVPYAEEIFKSTVAGSDSIFRKIFPKVEKGAPVECVANMPTYSDATYEILEGTDQIQVTEPDGRKTDGTGAKLYFPYFGSVYEYFLKGIQTALRPQGYGEPIVSGQDCTNLEEGDCSFSMKKISAAITKAASKYSVPEGILRAIFEIEQADEIANPAIYKCVENSAGAAGVAQVTRDTYGYITCDNERMEDIGMCADYSPKLSRCNFDDAFELMARTLLWKAGKQNQCKTTGSLSLSNKTEWYNAACNYYRTHNPDARTIAYANEIPENERRQDGDMSYCDIVCWRIGQCSGSNYPAR